MAQADPREGARHVATRARRRGAGEDRRGSLRLNHGPQRLALTREAAAGRPCVT